MVAAGNHTVVETGKFFLPPETPQRLPQTWPLGFWCMWTRHWLVNVAASLQQASCYTCAPNSGLDPTRHKDRVWRVGSICWHWAQSTWSKMVAVMLDQDLEDIGLVIILNEAIRERGKQCCRTLYEDTSMVPSIHWCRNWLSRWVAVTVCTLHVTTVIRVCEWEWVCVCVYRRVAFPCHVTGIMPGFCIFINVWLQKPGYKHWLRKDGINKWKAFCTMCKKSINIAATGEAPISHSKGTAPVTPGLRPGYELGMTERRELWGNRKLVTAQQSCSKLAAWALWCCVCFWDGQERFLTLQLGQVRSAISLPLLNFLVVSLFLVSTFQTCHPLSLVLTLTFLTSRKRAERNMVREDLVRTLHWHQSLDMVIFKTRKKEEDFNTDAGLTGFRFLDLELLLLILCPNCRRPIIIGGNKRLSHVRLSHVSEHRSSLASKLEFHCQCQHKVSLNTSKKKKKKKKKKRGRTMKWIGGFLYPCFQLGDIWSVERSF